MFEITHKVMPILWCTSYVTTKRVVQTILARAPEPPTLVNMVALEKSETIFDQLNMILILIRYVLKGFGFVMLPHFDKAIV